MVVNDLYLVSIRTVPDKAYAPLIVDPDAVLSPTVAPELFQLVTRRDFQIIEPLGSVQYQELPESLSLDVDREFRYVLSRENPFRVTASKGLNH